MNGPGDRISSLDLDGIGLVSSSPTGVLGSICVCFGAGSSMAWRRRSARRAGTFLREFCGDACIVEIMIGSRFFSLWGWTRCSIRVILDQQAKEFQVSNGLYPEHGKVVSN